MSELTIRNIQWFPGHMTKTRRMIAANLSLVDAVVEILDARIPMSSRNPDMDNMIGSKPRLFILNKSDMADPKMTDKWIAYFKKQGISAIAMDCKSGRGVKNFTGAVEQLLAPLLEKRKNAGMTGVPIRLMIVGIPNVGKSSFINRMAQSKRAKVEDRPGVTRTKQWVKIGSNMELLDMPGILWPKFDDQEIAKRLAFTGAINDDVVDIETLAMMLLEYLAKCYPDTLTARYKMTEFTEMGGIELLETMGRKRGMLISGGEVNTERAAITLIDEYRSGKLGRMTLESPEDMNNG
ncbi:MAG: ribosome biogenesis GTPase YlqF [Oscillospiraceae bacterium]|nr:ribosome biogenesis GTPase YlqF [Oscillospiraceae bacterium]